MVCDFRVVDEAASERPLASAGRERFAVGRFDGFYDARQRGDDVFGEMAAVGSRIADQLMPFVKRLCQIQRLLRAEAEKPVGVAL